MEVNHSEKQRLQQVLAELKTDRYPFWTLWREVADYYLPKRYVWLQSDKEARLKKAAKNPYILDSTGTRSARILASGMMNGITSPSRPWFKLRLPGFDLEGGEIAEWLDEVTRRMLFVMAESNFYNSIAVLYLDLVVFGSSSMLIYEDDESVIRCYNPALGEFYLGQSHRLTVDTFAREFKQTVKQMVTRFGEQNVSETVKNKWSKGGADALHLFDVTHLIEPNIDGKGNVPAKFAYRETYWETSFSTTRVLAQRGFNELPGIFPRWEVTANDSYGTSPAMEALPDVIQLQQETKRKAQGLDKMINPPLVADIQLQHRPMSLMPNGITYVAGQNSIGAKPLYTVALPINELSQDIQEVQARISETFHNSLFNMISQLNTVRSATEIDARREEKLVLMGSVLERFENEALDPAITRVFSIMQRRGLIPPVPAGLENVDLEVQYVSILSNAQRAVSAAPVERWLQLIGETSAISPTVAKIPDYDTLVRSYGDDIGVMAKNMKTREEVAAELEAEAERIQAQEDAVIGKELVDGAKTLSETDVGGGSNALQRLFAQG